MVILNDKKTLGFLSYKYHIRPTAHRLYGAPNSTSKHHQNVQRILRILALEGIMTTWDMAKIRFAPDSDKLRTKEKEYRRLINGRNDRGRYSEGIIDLGLILIDSKSTKRNPGNRYRLSLFGILYCLDVLNFSNKEIDTLAKNYKNLLPLIFGKWGFLKSLIGEEVYNISFLGKGLLFDNPNIIRIENIKFYELISFFNIKSNSVSQSLNEQKIGELISIWFYVTLLFFPNLRVKTKKNEDAHLRKILRKDTELKNWFSNFITEARTFYEERYKILESISFI